MKIEDRLKETAWFTGETGEIEEPVSVADWWEAENVRLYFELFEQYRDNFLKTK